MNGADYFMLVFVFGGYAIGPLFAALLVHKISRSSLFDPPEK
ncbi:hypothetical protein [Asaia sp. HN128]